MTKSQILEKILRDFRNQWEEAGLQESQVPECEKVIIDAIDKSLRGVEPDANIRTCEDFGHLDVKC